MKIEPRGKGLPHKQSMPAVAERLGHSPTIAAAHSLTTREHYFDEAVNVSLAKSPQSGAFSNARDAKFPVQQASARHRSPLHAGGQNDAIPVGTLVPAGIT